VLKVKPTQLNDAQDRSLKTITSSKTVFQIGSLSEGDRARQKCKDIRFGRCDCLYRMEQQLGAPRRGFQRNSRC
jgi:hypothetical protein